MATLVDGLGGEELAPSGVQPNIYFHPYFVGSITSEKEIVSLTSVNSPVISGTTIVNGQGALRSILLGSATTNTFGGFVQAGSFTTTAGSQGTIVFGTPYTSATSYYVTTTSCGSATGFDKSYISGTRNASGCNFVGAASLRYDWIAAGI